MSKQLSEKEVKQILGIENWRQMTKDKVISFASMMSEMDPVVAQKAIEQFPNFANMAIEALHDYKAVLDKSLDKNEASTQRCYDIWQATIDTLSKCASDDDITFEERKYYLDKMVEIGDKASAKDTENKQLIRNIWILGGIAVGSLLGVGLSLLGGRFDFHSPSKPI